MTTIKWTFVFIAAALLALGLGGVAYAYHSGGVAECTGCHSMHSPAAGGSALLIRIDRSSTCLSCHEHAGDTGPSSYHISTASGDMPAGTAPLQRTPGGDFGWLKKTYNFTVRGTATTELGQSHGHNIVAADFNYVVDGSNASAPGGTFASANLACSSCHDPHGRYRRLTTGVVAPTGQQIKASGSYNNPTTNEPDATGAVGVYRLLAGNGYISNGVTIGFTGVPSAKVPSSYNRTELTSQTRAAYGNVATAGHVAWGTWCATCHPSMHSSGNYVHPVDQNMSGATLANYNSYVKSGDVTGTQATSFLSLVPFVEGASDYPTLALHANNNNSYLTGPAGGDRVTCLSCHRAHASGWPFALRWNMEYEFMVYNGAWPGTDTSGATNGHIHRGRTSTETAAAYYDRPATNFASYQRVLCNKCHAKD